MTDLAIRVEILGKEYRIGTQVDSYPTLRDTLVDIVKWPVRMLRHGYTSSVETIWALRDISFEVKQGEVLGVIGRNGAGKSTLLKILSRVTEPTEGYAEIHGRVGSLLEVGTGFHPELTGRENIFLNGAILGMKRDEIEKKFDEIVDFSGVEKFIDTPVKRYSSGMYVRLAFAVAAHLESEILIVDEVLAVGDAEFQNKCIGKMGDVAAKEGRTVLFVSHNMGAVQMLCERGILLLNGEKTLDSTINATVLAYLKSFENIEKLNVSSRNDRHGYGDTRIQKIEISSEKTKSLGILATGAPATFTFFVSRVLPRMICQFNICDDFGQAIIKLSSDVEGPSDIFTSTHKNKFICKIDELPLVPGNYRINVAVSAQGVFQDHLEAAASFRVDSGMLKGRLISKASGNAKVCTSHSWIIPISEKL